MKACAHCCLWTDYDSDEDESRVNLPLSLAQLQEMDGTPAWWECGPEYSCWGIIARGTVAGVGRASPSFRDDGVKSILCITSKHAT